VSAYTNGAERCSIAERYTTTRLRNRRLPEGYETYSASGLRIDGMAVVLASLGRRGFTRSPQGCEPWLAMVAKPNWYEKVRNNANKCLLR